MSFNIFFLKITLKRLLKNPKRLTLFCILSFPSQVYIKNFTLAIQHEFAPYNITVQLVTPMYVKTKMNNYSSSVMTSGNLLIPDVQSYAKSAVFSLGKTSETTGYWSHGIQVGIYIAQNMFSIVNVLFFFFLKIVMCHQYGAMRLLPTWVRTICGKKMNEQFREEYYQMHGGDPSVLSQQNLGLIF